MKITIVVFLLAFGLMARAGFAIASGQHVNHDHGTVAQETAAPVSDAVEVGNKFCPVSGEEVGKMGDVVKKEYNGKIYNMCCKMCLKDFDKDPEKYSKIAEDEVLKAQKAVQ